MSYCMDKPNLLEFSVKMEKMTLKVKVDELRFQYQLRVSQDACLLQIWWFQLKSVTSYLADKQKFTASRTDGWTDVQMQAMTIHLQSERPRVNKQLKSIKRLKKKKKNLLIHIVDSIIIKSINSSRCLKWLEYSNGNKCGCWPGAV